MKEEPIAGQQPKLEPIIPDVHQWPIYQLSSHRYEFIHEVRESSIRKCLDLLQDDQSLIEELARALYQERIRLSEKPWKADPEDEKEYWSFVKSGMVKISQRNGDPDGQREIAMELMTSIISRYANEICGTFDPEIYEFAKLALPFGFTRLLNTSFALRFRKRISNRLSSIRGRFTFEGDIDRIRELGKNHTLVMLPTHLSNIDSPVIGWAIQEIGLPAFIYGAGLNLFGVKFFAYFMNRLGAYKVDRRKKSMFYLETLKEYSTLAIHKGAHSLFFPGGTRSRSGEVEKKLKLGLLGTAIEAQYLNYLHAKENEPVKKIIIIPVTLNYHFVLEAQSLINDYLKSTGKELYIAERDELSTTFKFLNFIRQFLTKGSKISVNFGNCMDLFGNEVLMDGTSVDKNGNAIDIKKYFYSNGQLKDDPQRNAEYIKLLGDVVVEKYHQLNIVFTSQLVAFVAFTMLRKRYKKQDIYGFLRTPLEDCVINYDEFLQSADRVRNAILELADEGKIKTTDGLSADIKVVVEHGLNNLGVYHSKRPLIKNKQGDITSQDLKLLYFYHNRLDGYQLGQYV